MPLAKIVIAFFAASTLCVSIALASPGNLDGKTFVGVVGEKGDKKGDADTFEFTDGNFHSTACDEYGYTAAPYTTKQDKHAAHFSSTTRNKDGDTITWNGSQKGDTIKGTALRKTKEGKQYSMWFDGKLKK